MIAKRLLKEKMSGKQGEWSRIGLKGRGLEEEAEEREKRIFIIIVVVVVVFEFH